MYCEHNPATHKPFNAHHGKSIWKQSVAKLEFWVPPLTEIMNFSIEQNISKERQKKYPLAFTLSEKRRIWCVL